VDQLYHDIDLVAVYDAVNASRSDFDFYINELPNTPASVLDIGCGTGTFALDLAKRGYTVTGVDPAPAMIATAKQKDPTQSVTWHTGLVSDLPRGQQFDIAIMTGHAFQCLLTDAEILQLFKAVQTRFAPNGSFWFETRNPADQAWRRWTPEHAKPAVELSKGHTVRVIHNVVEVKDDLVTFEERYEFNDATDARTSKSTLRFLELGEIKRLASRTGLNIEEVYGNWSKEAPKPKSPELILKLVQS